MRCFRSSPWESSSRPCHRPAAARGARTGYVGSYETLPILRSVGGRTVSLQDHAPFAAGVCGWASVAHVRTDHGRVSALRAMAALVEGPMLLSVYAPTWAPSTKAGVRGGISRWLYGDGCNVSAGSRKSPDVRRSRTTQPDRARGAGHSRGRHVASDRQLATCSRPHAAVAPTSNCNSAQLVLQ